MNTGLYPKPLWMKKFFYLLCVLTGVLHSCKSDKMEVLPQPVQATVSGHISYNGEPFQFDGNANNTESSTLLELRKKSSGESGTPLSPLIDAKGYFSQQILAGDYHITVKNESYPFTFDDLDPLPSGGYASRTDRIEGDYVIDIPVTPYFEITDVKTTTSATMLYVTFNINRVQDGADVTRAKVYVGTDSIVNSSLPASAEAEVTDISRPVTVAFSLPVYRTVYADNNRDYAYIRVALETSRSSVYLLHSDVYRVENIPVDYVDVTSTYLSNFKQPFDVVMAGDRWGKVTGWNVDPAIEPTMYDGLGDRMFMGAENWGGPDVIGSVWQNAELPAGQYIFTAKRGWNFSNLFGRTNRTYLTVSKGEALENSGANLLAHADCGLPANDVTVSVGFELTVPSKVSMGYFVNFVGGETNAVSFTGFTLLKVR